MQPSSSHPPVNAFFASSCDLILTVRLPMAWPPWDTKAIARTSTRPRGRPRNVPKLSAAEIAEAAARATGYRQLKEETGLSEPDARAVMRATKMTADEFADYQRGRLQDLADKLATKAAQEIEQLSPMQTVISLGVVTDKINQGPKAVSQSLHLHIKGDASSALQAILGPAAKSVFSAPVPQDSKATNYLPPRSAAPVIDVGPTETS